FRCDLTAGSSPTLKGIRSPKLFDKLDFISLMLALFAGTASLPHILIRYYTVKDQAAARKSTVVGIASIGFFYILTLYLGLGAMTSGVLDPTNNNMAAPLLARSFGELPFAVISAIAFTTVLGTVSGLILGAAQRRGLQEHLQVEARGRPGAVQPTSDRDVAAGVPGADRGVAADEGETHDKTCGLTTFSGTPPVSLVATCFATRLRKFASD